MTALLQILVDTSAWVAFFRNDRGAVARLKPLILDGRAAVSGVIYAEVLSGATTREGQERLRLLLKAAPWLPEPPQLWDRIADTRFLLARRGHQVPLVDVMIALTASEAGCRLLTRDRDFERIARVLPLVVEVF